jgi:hypothetical protein
MLWLSGELIGTTGYLTLYTRCRINRCRYNRVRLYFEFGSGYNSSTLRVSQTELAKQDIWELDHCSGKLIETIIVSWEAIRQEAAIVLVFTPEDRFPVHSVSSCMLWCAVLQAATRLRAMNSCVVLLTSTLLVGVILMFSISHAAGSAPLSR